MALKRNFEHSSVIESPFVDEVANTGHVVRAASPLQLAQQGASTGTIALREEQIAAEKKPAKPKADNKKRPFPNLKQRKENIDEMSKR